MLGAAMSMMRRFASANSNGSGGGAPRTPTKAGPSEPSSPSPDQSPLGSMWRASFDRDDADDTDDIESVSSNASRQSSQRGSVSSQFVDERSGFFSPPELVPPNVDAMDPVAYQYWLRIGTMCRQLLLIQGRIGLKKKQGKLYHVRACVVKPTLAGWAVIVANCFEEGGGGAGVGGGTD